MRTQQAMPAPAWEIIATPVWEGRTTHLTLLKRFHMAVHLHLAGDIHSPIRASGFEKDGSCPTACDTAPMLFGCDRSSRNWSVHQDKSQRWVGPHGPALASLSQQALGHVQKHVTVEPTSVGHKVSELCKKVRTAFSSVATYDMGSRLAADYRTLRNKLETVARRVEGLLIGLLRIHQLTSG